MNPEIRPVLKSVLATLTGLQVFWEEGRGGYIDPTKRAWVTLNTFGDIPLGRDERGQLFTPSRPAGTEVQEVVRGRRAVTLRVKVESFEQEDAKVSQEYMAMIRDLWAATEFRQLLLAVNLGFIRMGEVQLLSYKLNKHIVSAAATDFRLGYQTTRTAPTGFSYIEGFRLTAMIPHGLIKGLRHVHRVHRTGSIS